MRNNEPSSSTCVLAADAAAAGRTLLLAVGPAQVDDAPDHAVLYLLAP